MGLGTSHFAYFDWKDLHDRVALGTAVYQKETSALETTKQIVYIEKMPGENFLHYCLKALLTTLRHLRIYGQRNDLGHITLLNQNERIFQWVAEGTTNPEYAEIIEEIEAELQHFDLDHFSVKVIKGDHNRAKKLMKNLAAAPQARSLDLSRLKKTENVFKLRARG